jgi:sigma-B regulation protein RsbU (phosphoserine phosphatase)
MVVGLVGGLLFSQSVGRRLERLERGAEILGSGNLDHQVGTEARDEIGRLSRAFDRMAENLRRTMARRDELDREVEQRKRAQEALQNRERELERALDRLDIEMQAIADLQADLLPDNVPDMPGVALSTHYHPAQRAGGDYFDFFPIDESRRGILVADVSGRGVHASVIMAMTRVIAHNLGGLDNPESVLARLNEQLYANIPRGQFVAAVYGVLDTERLSFDFCLTGQPPPLYVAPSCEVTVLETEPRAGLGILPEWEAPVEHVSLEQGSHLLLHTDGVVEARNTAGEELELGRLVETVAANAAGDADDMRDAVQELVHGFCDFERFADDVTVLVLHVPTA